MAVTAMEQLQLTKENKIKLIEKLRELTQMPLEELTWDCKWSDIYGVINQIRTTLPEADSNIYPELEAFLGNTEMTNIKSAADTIKSYTFYNKTNLKAFSAPLAKTVEDQAFYDNTGLTKIYLDNCETIGNSSFYSDTNLVEILAPKLKTLNNYSFYNCQKLEIDENTFPELTTINNQQCFYNCKKLTNMNWSNLKDIGTYAFDQCSGLGPTLDLSNCTATIKSYAFRGCGLKEIIIGESIGPISNYAFQTQNSSCEILCEQGSKPSSWGSNWNSSGYKVFWNASIKTWTFNYNNGQEPTTWTGRVLRELPDSAKREGYELNGWYSDKELKVPFEVPGTSVDIQPKLYAGWAKKIAINILDISDNSWTTVEISADSLEKVIQLIADAQFNIKEIYADSAFTIKLDNFDMIPPGQTVYSQGTYLPKFEFEYTGAAQRTILKQGLYKLECWGAQGGNTENYQGGCGGYSIGYLNVTDAILLHVYVGGQGIKTSNSTSVAGGFNGGGACGGADGSSGSSGGGGSDIRLGQDSLYARVIVAGGGAGLCNAGGGTSKPGVGGGLSGGNAGNYYSGNGGKGGTQTAGGIKGTSNYGGTDGSFGQGGSTTYFACYGSGGGGGGWYGGGAGMGSQPHGSGYGAAGGGGSGYVYTSETAINYPAGCLLDSTVFLINAATIAGNQNFIAPNGIMELGHSGHGYVKITMVEGV